MIRILKVIALTIAILLTLATLPRLLINAPEIGMSHTEQYCARLEIGLFFDHPIEKLLIQRIVFTEKSKAGYTVKAYTLGGLTYATGIVSFVTPVNHNDTTSCNTHFKIIRRFYSP